MERSLSSHSPSAEPRPQRGPAFRSVLGVLGLIAVLLLVSIVLAQT